MLPVVIESGRKFGKLTAVASMPTDGQNQRWRCICECGKETVVRAIRLLSGETQSCGCVRLHKPGEVYGRLTTVRYAGRSRWLCMCECGCEAIAGTNSLVNGLTKSCGCLHRENTIKRSTKHGMHKARAYRIWIGMRARCENPSSVPYPYYGARGIKVCERWLLFENFYADMGDPPDRTSIERINNDGNYEPSNCRWATHLEQSRNRRGVHLLSYDGKTLTVTEWAELRGISRSSIYSRLKSGWTVERALTTPS